MDVARRKILLFAAYSFYASLLCPCQGFAFATASHEVINERATQGSPLLNPYLTEVLGFIDGFRTPIENDRGVNKSIIGWISEGGAAEDRLLFNGWFGEKLGGVTRSLNHFHQPLRNPWAQAGLIRANPSSARWAQDPHQAPGRMASWFNARSTFLDALKATTEQQRDAQFAETFQTLGQVMHLVADLASVAHTRDDPHPFAYEFEGFVLKRPDVINGFIGFDASILQQPTGDSFATLPIARLWDTNTYNGTNPPAELDQQIGLAEFVNANFFSRDTVRLTAGADPELPLPAIDRLDPGPVAADPRTGKLGRYLSKNRDGVLVTHMVRVSLFSNYAPIVKVILDDRVYEDYAQHLLPRAIGYSAGILDYFFRGKIKIEAPDRYAYSLAKYESGNTGFFTKMRFKVSNVTEYPNTLEDTVGAGQMWAVVRYRKPLSRDLIENPWEDLSEPFYAVSDPNTATLSRTTPEEHIFDFSGSNRIPTNAADIFLTVVWQGKLGMEDGAVLVGGKDLLEPYPLDFGDGSDHDCYKQNLYHVADLNKYPPYSSSQTQRDIDGPGGQKDGIPDIFGPYFTNDQFIKAYDPSNPKAASPTVFDYKVSQHQVTVTEAQFSRFMLLQDKPVYNFSWLVNSFFDVPTQTTVVNPGLFDFALVGVFNDHVVDSAGNRIRRVSSSFRYRGISTFQMFMFVVGGMPRFGPCMSASFSIQEPFTRIEGELAPE
jgi:hypothetical protein